MLTQNLSSLLRATIGPANHNHDDGQPNQNQLGEIDGGNDAIVPANRDINENIFENPMPLEAIDGPLPNVFYYNVAQSEENNCII